MEAYINNIPMCNRLVRFSAFGSYSESTLENVDVLFILFYFLLHQTVICYFSLFNHVVTQILDTKWDFTHGSIFFLIHQEQKQNINIKDWYLGLCFLNCRFHWSFIFFSCEAALNIDWNKTLNFQIQILIEATSVFPCFLIRETEKDTSAYRIAVI